MPDDGPSRLASSAARLSGDWPSEAATQIERTVASVREKTTGPALTAARGLVYGLFGAIVGTFILILAVIGVVRGLTEVVDRVWITYLILGTVLTAGGSWAWRKRF